VDDIKFLWYYETPFNASSLQHRWYISLGNHDHRGNVDAQIERSKVSHRWYLPARWYSEVFCFNGQRIHMMVLDSDKKLWKVQMQWAVAQFEETKSDWRIVVNHNPLYSAAQRPLTGNTRRLLEPFLAKYKVHLYLNGHMHLMEVYRSLRGSVGYTGFTTGSFCDLYTTRPRESWPPQVLYANAMPGFLTHRLAGNVLTTNVIGIQDEVLMSVDVERELKEDGGHRKVRILSNRTWNDPSFLAHF